MAFVGMRYVVYAPIKKEVAGQAIEYSDGVVVGRAIGATVNITRNSESLYADDIEAENDNSITGGTVDINVDDVSDEVAAVVFGHVKGDSDTEYGETDAPSPYGGLGYIRVRSKGGKASYQANWIYKTQLGVATETAATKTQSTTWQTPTMTGSIMGVKPKADGKTYFRSRWTFNTEKEAQDKLNTLANITTAAAASETEFANE